MIARRLVDDRRFDVAALGWMSSALLVAVGAIVFAVREGREQFAMDTYAPFDGWWRISVVAEVTDFGFVIAVIIGIVVAALWRGPLSRGVLALGFAGAAWIAFAGVIRLALVFHRIDIDQPGYGQAERISEILHGLAIFGLGAVLVVASWQLLRTPSSPDANAPNEPLPAAFS